MASLTDRLTSGFTAAVGRRNLLFLLPVGLRVLWWIHVPCGYDMVQKFVQITPNTFSEVFTILRLWSVVSKDDNHLAVRILISKWSSKLISLSHVICFNDWVYLISNRLTPYQGCLLLFRMLRPQLDVQNVRYHSCLSDHSKRAHSISQAYPSFQLLFFFTRKKCLMSTWI